MKAQRDFSSEHSGDFRSLALLLSHEKKFFLASMRIFVSMQFLMAEHIEITDEFCIASVEWWSGVPTVIRESCFLCLVGASRPVWLPGVFPLCGDHAGKDATHLIRQRCAEAHGHWQSISISGLRARRRTQGPARGLVFHEPGFHAPRLCLVGAWQGSQARQLHNRADATVHILSSWSCPHYH